MKKYVLALLVGTFVLAGCASGVSQKEYDRVLAENESLKNQVLQYESQQTVKTETDDSIPESEEYETTTTSTVSEPAELQVDNTPAPESDFFYVNNGAEVQINGYKGNGGKVVIPAEIEGATVTRIAPNAFRRAENITEIVLPKKLQYIGDSAFYSLKNLTGVVVIPETVTEIDGHAFQSTGLTGIAIKSSCKLNVNAFANITPLEFVYVSEGCAPKIGTSVFSYSEKLSTTVFPGSVKEIKDETFKACNNMVIYAPQGSFAEEYGNRNFIKVDTAGYSGQVAAFSERFAVGTKNQSSEQANVCRVESTYNTAGSLSIDKLDKKYSSFLDKTEYFYGELIIQQDDKEWLESPLNADKILEYGALYRTMAKYLVGFSMNINDGSAYCDVLTGKQWVDRATFEPLVENAKTFIVMGSSKQIITAIMREFQSLHTVKGTFDFEYGDLGKYVFDIPDLTKCAEEMQISEEMLGYIFNYLDGYAPTISFSGNSAHFEYTSWK